VAGHAHVHAVVAVAGVDDQAADAEDRPEADHHAGGVAHGAADDAVAVVVNVDSVVLKVAREGQRVGRGHPDRDGEELPALEGLNGATVDLLLTQHDPIPPLQSSDS
jgi:hypothetical protein